MHLLCLESNPIEMVDPEKRVFCTIVSNIAYSCGLLLLAEVYLIRDWRYLSLAVSLPLLLLFACFFVLPESPRLLLAVNQPERAAKILKSMAPVNGASLPSNFASTLAERFQKSQSIKSADSSSSTFGLLDLFRPKNMRPRI
uniref:Major facilitator superfamily (MFS) profile domain-containing protein n=1 Tax=Glossina pallidipes TaxID=7398 RepID=A0A1A9Z8I6_GLOPL